ncbi:hypothetical protein [Paraburkholderia oxyphila]|uniref:hypothetical protein n=1 Tax=Paraburkholderia oxyphila TaxID=614212 RepID=UPI0012EDEC1B|nr:hypothetical protein [Paraburkholderia oxyphila]
MSRKSFKFAFKGLKNAMKLAEPCNHERRKRDGQSRRIFFRVHLTTMFLATIPDCLRTGISHFGLDIWIFDVGLVILRQRLVLHLVAIQAVTTSFYFGAHYEDSSRTRFSDCG